MCRWMFTFDFHDAWPGLEHTGFGGRARFVAMGLSVDVAILLRRMRLWLSWGVVDSILEAYDILGLEVEFFYRAGLYWVLDFKTQTIFIFIGSIEQFWYIIHFILVYHGQRLERWSMGRACEKN